MSFPFNAVYCQVLCQMCQDVNPDPWIIQLCLGKLGSSLHVCFGQGLDTDDLELKCLQTLACSLHSVNQLTVHSLGPVEGMWYPGMSYVRTLTRKQWKLHNKFQFFRLITVQSFTMPTQKEKSS